ncbi:hypothetical protein Tco_0565653 [Tanacetum coccineum]
MLNLGRWITSSFTRIASVAIRDVTASVLDLRLNDGSDTEIAASVIVGEIGPRVLAVEGQMQVMASQMIQAVDRVEQVSAQVELGRCAAERHADPVAADYCYRDEQQGEHADAVHFGIGETDCSLREKTTRTPVVLFVFSF